MGLIKKKTAVRTTEGGIKYICDICSSDITATVSLVAPSVRTLPYLAFRVLAVILSRNRAWPVRCLHPHHRILLTT